MMQRTWTLLLLLLGLFITLHACDSPAQPGPVDGLAMAVKMAESEISHFPEPWTVDFNPKPIWNYTQGLIAHAMILVWKENGNETFYNYAKTYADKFIDDQGNVATYKVTDYNIDCVNSGKFLFDVFERTKEDRYLQTIHLMRDQLKTQPRTSEGGFWHKQRYPHQMWLDGLYMGAPFYAQYAVEMNQVELFDDVVRQFVTIHRHTYNPEVGLNYHAWDESREQEWADSITGHSPHYWGRSMGWYAMALVDVLDFIPLDHPGRPELLQILNQVAGGIKKYQDDASGVWYQVLDQGIREGNYLEATASSMFTYALLKASRKGYISAEYKATAVKGYKGILANFIQENGDGTISLTKCCAVAGLGGNPYRDGSFEYYISEPVRDNDPKGVGPFIMASLEFHKQ